MVLIYLPVITNRSRYIFKLFFEELIGLEHSLTESLEELAVHDGPKISYSEEDPGNGIYLRADPLLIEKDLGMRQLHVTEYDGVPVIFETDDPKSALPFDPFAAGFYMVTRFEEYDTFKGDRYGRFQPKDSIAFKGNFLRKPVVNLWANIVRDLLVRNYPGLQPKEKAYRFVPTIDIDHAYAFGHRKFIRIIAGFSRDISNGRLRNLIMRARVMFKKVKDPYDNYSLILDLHDKAGVRPIFFILFADYGGNDNNVSLRNKEFRELIRHLDKRAGLGIHPSLASGRKSHLLKNEIGGLSHLLHRKISRSRQHFLKITFPRTYRNLIKLGIKQDYSMGYASEPGFRAGIADPFRFFDLAENKETELLIHPVTIMDVTLRDYLGLDREKSLETILSMIDIVRSVSGEFVSLWHNESFSGLDKWKDWENLYEQMLRNAAV